MEWFLKVVQDNYANFKGRARRKEYWMFTLVNGLISAGLTYLTYTNPSLETVSIAFDLGVLIPAIAVGVRRMHDVGKSGWFILVPFYSFYLAISEGDKGENEYGLDPKKEDSIFLFGEKNEDDDFDLLD